MSSILIGLAPGDRGEAAGHLGAMIARSTGFRLVVAAITPEPWPRSPFLGDEEFLAVQREAADEALDRARGIIGDAGEPELVVRTARSVTDGLLQVSAEHEAALVVLGSGTSGLPGRVSLGSIAQRILHSLDTPVCFAPADFAVPAGSHIGRITVGFGRADTDSELLTAALRRAEEFGIPLRVVCFAVRPETSLRGTIETAAEDLVVGEWADRVRTDIRTAAGRCGVDADSLEIVIGSGVGWAATIASIGWLPTDLLAIGAKTSAISRFLLGSHAAKIVRHSPVPVLTVARGSLDT